MHDLKASIREIPDFPKPGIRFYDITTLLKDPGAFRRSVDLLEQLVVQWKPDALLAIESRGFIFGAALAYQMNLGLLVARKPGKLPGQTDSVSYDLEYGSNTLELHTGAVEPGQRVAVVDDLLATGGTAAACGQLIEKQGGLVAGFAFVVELSFLHGREKLTSAPVGTLLVYDSE